MLWCNHAFFRICHGIICFIYQPNAKERTYCMCIAINNRLVLEMHKTVKHIKSKAYTETIHTKASPGQQKLFIMITGKKLLWNTHFQELTHKDATQNLMFHLETYTWASLLTLQYIHIHMGAYVHFPAFPSTSFPPSDILFNFFQTESKTDKCLLSNFF